MQLTMPDAATLERVRRAAIVRMSQMGLIAPFEIPALAAAHVDDVLDRLFQHCGTLRVRVADNRYLEIHRGRTVQ